LLVVSWTTIVAFHVSDNSNSSNNIPAAAQEMIIPQEPLNEMQLERRLNISILENYTVHEHAPPALSPWHSIPVNNDNAPLLKETIRDELQSMGTMPFLSWGVYPIVSAVLYYHY